MAGAAEFVVRLRDKVSGPAAKAAGSIDKLNGRVRDARGRFNKAGGAMGAAGEAGQQSMFRTVMSSQLAVGAITAVAGAAMAAGRALLQMGAAGAAKLGQSVAFAENIRFALSKFLGSADNADRAIAKLMKTANELGVSFQDAASNFRAFVSAGFSEEDAMGLVKFKADILAIGDGTDVTAERISEAFKQVEKAMATGRIEADAFNAILSNLPVNKAQVLTVMAKKLGKTYEEVAKMDVTKLPVKELMESFQEATLAVTGFGKNGEAAIAKQLSTMTGMYGFIKNNLANAFDGIASKMAPKLAKALLPMMERLSAFLSSPEFEDFMTSAAEGLVQAIVGAADAMERFINAATKGEVSKTLKKWVEQADSAAAGITRILEALGMLPGSAEEAGGAFGTFMDVIGWVGDVISYLTDQTTGLGKVITTVVSFMAAWLNPLWYTYHALRLLWQAVVWVGEAVGGAFSAAWEWVSSVVSGAGASIMATIGELWAWVTSSISNAGAAILSAATSLGSNIVNGIAQGIMGAASAVIAALTGVVGDALTQAKALLGIASPSKVFKAFGLNTAMGMAIGLEDGTPAVKAAMSGMVSPNITSGGTTVNQISTSANVSIPAAADPQATAEAVRQMVVSQLGDTLEQLTIQVGAA